MWVLTTLHVKPLDFAQVAGFKLRSPDREEINTFVLVSVTCLRVGQRVVMIRSLVDIAAMLVFSLCVLIVALCAVVYGLEKVRLVLLHHIGGGTAVG